MSNGIKKFGGRVISTPSKWANGSGAFLVKVTSCDGAAIKPRVVDIKDTNPMIESYEAKGLAKGAVITLSMQGILKHTPPVFDANGKQVGGDRVLKAKQEGEADTPIHRPSGYVRNSVEVLLGAQVEELELETDPQQAQYANRLNAVTAGADQEQGDREEALEPETV